MKQIKAVMRVCRQNQNETSVKFRNLGSFEVGGLIWYKCINRRLMIAREWQEQWKPNENDVQQEICMFLMIALFKANWDRQKLRNRFYQTNTWPRINKTPLTMLSRNFEMPSSFESSWNSEVTCVWFPLRLGRFLVILGQHYTIRTINFSSIDYNLVD